MDVHYASVLFILLNIYYTVAQDDEKPSIYSLHVDSKIRCRFATTLITSKIANPANVSREAIFDVDIPSQAFISNFSMVINGITYYGEVRSKKYSQDQYDQSKRQGDSAGQITAKPNAYNKFSIAVNVAATSKVTFNLTYDELLERRGGIYNHEIYINPGQPVRDIQVKVSIQETRAIKDISVPTLTTEIPSVIKKAKMVAVDQPAPNTANIQFSPTTSQQGDGGLAGKFIVQYDVERDYSVGDVYVVDGYFVHFFAPNITEEFPRDILFILDTSTSMADRKLGQMKDAMAVIIKELSEQDRFNIMVFNIKQTLWADGFQPVTSGTKSKALKFIKNLRTSQYTDIQDALINGMKMFKKDAEGVPMIFFLTDGEPTRGNIRPAAILSWVKSDNTQKIPIYSLAFGKDSDWNLMNRLSFNSGGVARRIFEGASASLQIAQFYKEVSKVLLEDITIKYSNVNRTAKVTNSLGIFVEDTGTVLLGGSEIIVAGKVRENSTSFDLVIDAKSTKGSIAMKAQGHDGGMHFDNERNILERLWAYLTIKEYLETTAASNTHEGKRSYAERLALKYGFVTPTTSMFIAPSATNLWKSYDEDYNQFYLRTPRPTIKPRPTRAPRVWYGGGGGGGWGGGGGDPHFMIGLNSLDYPLCFDVVGEKDEIYNIFQDLNKDVTVNVRFDTGVKKNRNGGKRVYIKEAAILFSGQTVYVTHDVIELDNRKYLWEESLETRMNGAWLIIDGDTEIVKVVFDNGLEAEVARRTHHKHTHIGDDFINVEVRHEEHASVYVTGLVGQFMQKNIELKLIRLTDSDAIVGHLIQKHGDDEENKSRAKLVTRHDPVLKTKRQCWMLREQGLKNLVNPDKFRISNIFSHRF